MVSYLTTLFLGKPPGGSLQVLSTHSFASNCQLALLDVESEEEGKYFSTNITETSPYECDPSFPPNI